MYNLSADQLRSREERTQCTGRGLPFELVEEFEFGTAMIGADTRRDYGEPRWLALGLIRDRVHALCFTARDEGIRLISLRKANDREVRRYECARTDDR
jgi:uncharacterized protein